MGGLVGAVAADKLGKNNGGPPTEAGNGAAFPKAASVLGVSSQRLMAFEHGSLSGKPEGMIASAPIDDVAEMSAEKNKLAYTLGIGFKDGSSVSYEVVKLAKPGEFVATFECLRRQPAQGFLAG